jgi:hypothetical protein
MVLLPALCPQKLFVSVSVGKVQEFNIFYILFCASAKNQICSNINIFGSWFFNINLLVNLIDRYLQYFVKFNVL